MGCQFRAKGGVIESLMVAGPVKGYSVQDTQTTQVTTPNLGAGMLVPLEPCFMREVISATEPRELAEARKYGDDLGMIELSTVSHHHTGKVASDQVPRIHRSVGEQVQNLTVKTVDSLSCQPLLSCP
jgi:hypothetical protein